jgi:excisionase family DNA binding protein
MTKVIVSSAEEIQEMINNSNAKLLKDIEKTISSAISPIKANLTVKETAEKLNVFELTIRNYIKRGIIKADKIGRRVLINSQDLENSLSEIKSQKYQRD